MTPNLEVRYVRGACPLDCPDTCSWIVTVRQGDADALRGDPAHPYTRGSLCNKVVDYLNYARAPERLLYPLRRTGPKGTGEFTRISWDEALHEIASRLRDVVSKDGAEAIWPIAGSGNMGLIQGIYGAGRRKEGVTVKATVADRDSDMGGGAVYHDNRVRVDRV
jgi:anaerobic selenocysteine-containing dehydrogenase